MLRLELGRGKTDAPEGVFGYNATLRTTRSLERLLAKIYEGGLDVSLTPPAIFR